jgi:hypothetical protein
VAGVSTAAAIATAREIFIMLGFLLGYTHTTGPT